jgi:hypothetical protein
MIDELALFKGNDFKVNDKITIHHPRLGEICDFGEERYYELVLAFTATPFDFKVQLYDMGIDYENISDFDLFLITYQNYKIEDTSILFGNLDFSKFVLKQNAINDELVLFNEEEKIIIDKVIFIVITDFIRSINFFKRNLDKAGNAHTKEYLIEKERRKLQRQKNKPYVSTLVRLISAMINSENFKYRYDDVWNLPIYVLNDSIRRIQKIKNYEHLMFGVYTGNVSMKNISEENLDWLGSLH